MFACGCLISSFPSLLFQGEMVQWTVFLISYWGAQIGQKVKKICDWWVMFCIWLLVLSVVLILKCPNIMNQTIFVLTVGHPLCHVKTTMNLLVSCSF